MTIDGFCDHTAGIADDELHEHYSDLLKNADTILYGRVTYELMEYWPTVIKNPTGNTSIDEFAVTIDDITKVVFSHTRKNFDWRNTMLANGGLEEEVSVLKQQQGKPVLIGSPSLIAQATEQQLIDEFQLCIHPVIAGSGLVLFKNITNNIRLKLVNMKRFGSGAVILYYERGNS